MRMMTNPVQRLPNVAFFYEARRLSAQNFQGRGATKHGENTDAAYFRFRQSVRDARGANGNPFGQPSAIFSNVQGGVGIFTVLSGTTALKILR